MRKRRPHLRHRRGTQAPRCGPGRAFRHTALPPAGSRSSSRPDLEWRTAAGACSVHFNGRTRSWIAHAPHASNRQPSWPARWGGSLRRCIHPTIRPHWQEQQCKLDWKQGTLLHSRKRPEISGSQPLGPHRIDFWTRIISRHKQQNLRWQARSNSCPPPGSHPDGQIQQLFIFFCAQVVRVWTRRAPTAAHCQANGHNGNSQQLFSLFCALSMHAKKAASWTGLLSLFYVHAVRVLNRAWTHSSLPPGGRPGWTNPAAVYCFLRALRAPLEHGMLTQLLTARRPALSVTSGEFECASSCSVLLLCAALR